MGRRSRREGEGTEEATQAGAGFVPSPAIANGLGSEVAKFST